jgi:DNA helicase TIP49 (TBP-interacting protein)
MNERKMLTGHTPELLRRKCEDFLARLAKRFGDMKGKIEISLYGPPGTGKTLLAMALAREAEAVFFHVRVTNVVAKWYADSLEVLQTVKLNSADLAEVVRRSLEEKVQQEGAGEEPGPVTTADMQRAIENYRKTKEIIEKIRYGQYL